ncbi:MAG TPA: ABC transporter ATP-binding protein [Planctomycetota bacterium]|nr:ABC transporter ATP-binding protein [Planctomycetota bacterium]
MTALIAMRGVTRAYATGRDQRVAVLRGVDLAVERGEFIALMGPSGSGKSTLMHIIGCLDLPDSGTYALDGEEVTGLDDLRLSQLRGRRIGFVFQSFNLIPELTVLDNTELPLFYLGVKPRERRQRSRALLEQVGLGHRLEHRSNQLSGGEMQRVAIARAVIAEPLLLVADEPTGNLDSASGLAILDLFAGLHARGLTIVMVTHDQDTAARAGRIVRMRDGVPQESVA